MRKQLMKQALEEAQVERDATGRILRIFLDGQIFIRQVNNQVLRKERISTFEMTDKGIHIIEGGR